MILLLFLPLIQKVTDIYLILKYYKKNYEEALKLKNEKKYDIELIEATTLHDVIEALNKR